MTELEPYSPGRAGAEMVHHTPELDSWLGVLAQVVELARGIADTDFVPKEMRGNHAAVTAAILAGREMGVPPMTALAHVHLINGRPGQSANLMRALVLAAGHQIEYQEVTSARCVVRGRRRGENSWTTVMFTADEARTRRTQNMGTMAEDMLVARATSRLCRRLFADCIMGIPYSVEDVQAGDTGELTELPAVEMAPANGRTAQRRPPRTPPAAAAATEQQPETAPPAPPPAAEDTPAAPQPPLPGEAGYDEQPDDPERPITKPMLTKLHTVLTNAGITDKDERRLLIGRIVRRPDLASSNDLTFDDGKAAIDFLEFAESSERRAELGISVRDYVGQLLDGTEEPPS